MGDESTRTYKCCTCLHPGLEMKQHHGLHPAAEEDERAPNHAPDDDDRSDATLQLSRILVSSALG
jgi:hypothetical protein